MLSLPSMMTIMGITSQAM
ncbi:Protein of unknown function [Streptococcus thermophilus]|nr:Protein of unknown function [Streptococcus thermophilus]